MARWLPALAWLAAARASAAPPPRVLLELARDAPAWSAAPIDPAAGAALFVNGIGQSARRELGAALAALAAGLEHRRNPLYTPLDDADDLARAQAVLTASGPARTAAATLAAGRWQSADHDLAIRATAGATPGARRVSLAAPGAGDDLARRVRFLAWPIGYAVVVRTPSARVASALAESVRVALVLTAADLHAVRADPDIAAIRRDAARVVAIARPGLESAVTLLSLLARRPALDDEVPWLRLPRGAVLFVPRLGALSDPDALLAEVRASVAGASGVTVSWLGADVSGGGRAPR